MEEKIKAIPDQSEKNPAQCCGLLFVVAVSVFVSVVSTIGGISVYDKYMAPKVVTVDVTSELDRLKGEVLKGNMNFEQMDAEMEKWNAKFDAVPKNHILVMKQMVIRNGEAFEF